MGKVRVFFIPAEPEEQIPEDWIQSMIDHSDQEDYITCNGSIYTVGDPVSIQDFENMASVAIHQTCVYNDKSLLPDEGGWFFLERDRLMVNGWALEDAELNAYNMGLTPNGPIKEQKKEWEEYIKTAKMRANLREMLTVRKPGGIRDEAN